MVIKTKRFYVNGKSCKVELKKERNNYGRKQQFRDTESQHCGQPVD